MEKIVPDTLQEEKQPILCPEKEDPIILEEIEIEELFIDGICGVY